MIWLPLLPVAHWEVTTGRRPWRLHFIHYVKDVCYPVTAPHQTDPASRAPVTIQGLKIKLRRDFLSARSQVAEQPAAAIAVAAALRAALSGIPGHGTKTIGGYIPIGDELDCRPALAVVAAMGVRVCLPVVGPRGERLRFRQWQPGENLVTGPLGTFHPSPDAPTVDPDVLLVPVVAFDGRGHRLGRGGGYYDSTLAALRAERTVLAIGLAFDIQEVLEVPAEPNDQPLDMVITERRTLSFSREPLPTT